MSNTEIKKKIEDIYSLMEENKGKTLSLASYLYIMVLLQEVYNDLH